MTQEEIIEKLEEAIKALEPPFLALHWTAEGLAYRRGARDAYIELLKALRDGR
jgi:hypothetical protein